MQTPTRLLQAYLAEIQDPPAAAALFAEDGVIELPALSSMGIDARAQGPAAIEKFIAGLLSNVPDFRFKDVQIFIETPEQVFAEYSVEAQVRSTNKLYRQTYAGRLVMQDGKIKLLRESLDTLAAYRAFTKDA